MSPASPLIEGPGGWLLDPAGAAVHPDEATAVVADVHLGYEWARGASGDCIPAHSLAETIGLLEGLLSRSPVRLARLVVAGDLVESPRPCFRTDRDIAALGRWLEERGVTLTALKGNHDPPGRGWPAVLDVAGWTIGHGDRPIAAARTIVGHAHPALRAQGLVAPCFVVGPAAILLPAFSPNAAGVGIEALGLGRRADAGELRCIASAGGALLDFGPVLPLLDALQT